jgi:hypothetical protein
MISEHAIKRLQRRYERPQRKDPGDDIEDACDLGETILSEIRAGKALRTINYPLRKRKMCIVHVHGISYRVIVDDKTQVIITFLRGKKRA